MDRQDPVSTKANPLPLYIRICEIVADRIQSGKWHPRKAVASERALAQEFGVSIGTIRRAMDELSLRGLVVRRRGQGRFVSNRFDVAGTSLLDSIRLQNGSAINWDPPRTVVALDEARPAERVMFNLGEHQAHIMRFEWLTGRNGRRTVLQRTAVPAELARLDVNTAQHIQSLDELCERVQIFLGRTEIAMSVANVDRDVADRLRVPLGSSLQRLQRRLFDLQGKVVALSDDWLTLRDEVYAFVQPRTQQ